MKMMEMEAGKASSTLFGPAVMKGKGKMPVIAMIVQGTQVTKTALKILGIDKA